jgi:cobalt-zinc-cadmium efflux system membrane fusion protein
MTSKYLILAVILAIAACGGESPGPVAEDGHADGEADHEEARGPHGGRLLADGDFAVEMTIFEDGVPPEFRAYVYRDGKPVDPSTVTLEVDLVRLGDRVERVTFAPDSDFLRSRVEVKEPHSFTVRIRARHDGDDSNWSYDSLEGRTRIEAASAAASGIAVEAAGPARIRESLTLHGTVVPDPQRVFRLHARFPGVVKSVRRQVGDRVSAGEVLAVIESNESLQRYDVVAPAAGVIVSRDVNPGVAVADAPILTLVDLWSVWVELASFQHDLGRIRAGQPVLVRDIDGHVSKEGRVESVAVVGSPASQSMTVRVVLPNADGHWRPGLFVTGEVTVAEAEVPIAVRRIALQTFRDWEVAFERVGEDYEVRPLELGRRDGDWAEVLGGLEPGAFYVTENSYLIKADIEKSGASHDH